MEEERKGVDTASWDDEEGEEDEDEEERDDEEGMREFFTFTIGTPITTDKA